MSDLITRLKTIGTIVVGSSAEYAITQQPLNRWRWVAAEGVAGEPVREVTWRVRCLTVFVDGNVAAGQAALRDALCRRGQAVVLKTYSHTQTLPAAGGSGGCIVGYPMVSVDFVDSVGFWQEFELEVVARIPLVQATDGGYSIVELTTDTEESEDDEGNITTTVTGSLRVRPDQNAKAAALALLITPAKTAAQGAGKRFTRKVMQGLDGSYCTFGWTVTPQGSNPPPSGVEEAEVNDRTSETSVGVVTRTVSGWARGAGATAFAVAQEPTPGTNQLLARRDVGEPRIADGRVEFSYELRTGVSWSEISGIAIFGLTDRIEEVPGGRPIVSGTYHNTAPRLWRSEQQPWGYRQAISFQFTGAWPSTPPAGAFSDDNLVLPPAVIKGSTGPGLREYQVSRVWIFASQQSLPDPEELPVMS